MFLGEFYDDRAYRVQAIVQEARKYADKYKELIDLQKEFTQAQRDLVDRGLA